MTIPMFVRLWKASAGSAAVEFALISPLFVIMLMGLYDFARLFWAQHALEYAVEQTGRWAIVNSAGDFGGHCSTILSNMGPSGANCVPTSPNPTYKDSNKITTTYAQVTASYVFNFSVWCPAGVCPSLNLQSISQVPIGVSGS